MEHNEVPLAELSMKQELHRKQLAENREKMKERKQRAHRLICRGAYVESLIPDAANMSDEEFKVVLRFLLHMD